MPSKFTKPVIPSNELNELETSLVNQARQAAQFAYAPYSKFTVGAALLAENNAGDRKIFQGGNIEIANFTSNCAENVVGLKAVSEGYAKFITIAVVCAKHPGGAPCGNCRQFLREFGGLAAVVLIIQNKNNDVTRWTIDELLPDSFGAEML